ncbi:hypothetical protein QE152_g37320 [Popillia japonica]|uniref:Uncharacterized protein n=1 Tax=Popillia japonica TaxID=7064 RepID=A0AAW1IAV3_POPJA
MTFGNWMDRFVVHKSDEEEPLMGRQGWRIRFAQLHEERGSTIHPYATDLKNAPLSRTSGPPEITGPGPTSANPPRQPDLDPRQPTPLISCGGSGVPVPDALANRQNTVLVAALRRSGLTRPAKYPGTSRGSMVSL